MTLDQLLAGTFAGFALLVFFETSPDHWGWVCIDLLFLFLAWLALKSLFVA